MQYEFRFREELAWALAISLLTVAGSSLAFDQPPDDWAAWGFALAVGCTRAAIGATLDVLRRRGIASSGGGQGTGA